MGETTSPLQKVLRLSQLLLSKPETWDPKRYPFTLITHHDPDGYFQISDYKKCTLNTENLTHTQLHNAHIQRQPLLIFLCALVLSEVFSFVFWGLFVSVGGGLDTFKNVKLCHIKNYILVFSINL